MPLRERNVRSIAMGRPIAENAMMALQNKAAAMRT
jgi:hypothetical protein